MEFSFFCVEFGFGGQITGALIVWAFVDGKDFGFFPEIEGIVTAGTPVFGLRRMTAVSDFR